MKYRVKYFVTINFGTLSGWGHKDFDTLEAAQNYAGKWDMIYQVDENGNETEIKKIGA